MFDFRKNTRAEATQGAEKLNYSKYYEHDGALRAYANSERRAQASFMRPTPA